MRPCVEMHPHEVKATLFSGGMGDVTHLAWYTACRAESNRPGRLAKRRFSPLV